MSDDFFILPPDGTGKRVNSELMIKLTYDGGTVDILVDDEITGASSGVIGKVLKVVGTTASGTIWVLPNDTDTTTYTNDEALTVSAGNVAVANGVGQLIYTQSVFQVGGNNPKNIQSIDAQGQAYMRFAEGPFQFDSFGKGRTSSAELLHEYIHQYDILPNEWSDETTGGATIEHVKNESAVLL